jgi:hypothetical protein
VQHKIDFQPVPLRLQMLDVNGDIIGTDGITPAPVFDGSGDRRQVFSVTARIPSGAAGVRIVNEKDDVLWKWLGGDDPRLELGGVEVSQSDNQLRISWKSGGMPEPRHLIEYSPDGNQWQSIALDFVGNELAVDTTHFPGGQSARVRLTSYAGLVSKTIVSEPFAVATKSPIASIIAPDSKRTIDRGAPVLLRGFAYDAEDGSLPGQSMHWSIDGYGDIGSGDWVALPELPAGTHIVRLTVTDREQRPAEAKTEIRIGEPSTPAPKQ